MNKKSNVPMFLQRQVSAPQTILALVKMLQLKHFVATNFIFSFLIDETLFFFF